MPKDAMHSTSTGGAHPQPISVYLVSGAEEHRIGASLASVHGWASEIHVVLNHDVSDRTEEIARGLGAVVHREPWKGFVGQKNSALAKTLQPWVLNLDADEVVPRELRDEIAQAIRAAGPDVGAFRFPRCTEFLGRWIRHGDWYPDRVTRLSRRGAASWAGQEPHATLLVSGRTETLRSDLLHYSNESIDRQVSKIGPYSEAFARAAAASGRKAGVFDLVIRPIWRFVRGYFLRLGFLDGLPGYYIAWSNAFTVVTRYAKLRQSQRAVEPAPSSGPPPATVR